MIDFSPEFQPDGEKSTEAYTKIHFNAFSKGEQQQFKWRFKRIDNSEFDAEVILTPYDHLDFSKWMIIIQDISELKISEEQAKEISELKTKETINLTKQEKLQSELDLSIRELSSNLLLDSQRSNLLSSIRQTLLKIKPELSSQGQSEINRILRNIDRNVNLEEGWKKFQLHFEKVHPNFFVKISNQFPELNAKQLRHCAYIKLGLSSKETASLLNVAPKSVEMARYRLKKKMNFGCTDRFSEFIHSI